eukprot:scaffold405692_cov16-Prasinocladus_malaysianus.AAC.1
MSALRVEFFRAIVPQEAASNAQSGNLPYTCASLMPPAIHVAYHTLRVDAKAEIIRREIINFPRPQ